MQNGQQSYSGLPDTSLCHWTPTVDRFVSLPAIGLSVLLNATMSNIIAQRTVILKCLDKEIARCGFNKFKV